MVEAAHIALDTRGAGLSSVRFICGTQVTYLLLMCHFCNVSQPLSPPSFYISVPLVGTYKIAQSENPG